MKSALSENRDQFNLDYSANPNSYRELLPWHDRATPNRTLIRAVGYHLVFGSCLPKSLHPLKLNLSEAHQQKPITVSAVIALLLLCEHRERVQVLQLMRDVGLLCTDIASLGYEVVGWDDEVDADQAFEDAILHFPSAISVSRNHEEHGVEGVWVQANQSHHSIVDLCYRKNGALAPFALLSVISITLQAAKIDPLTDINIPIDDLINKSLTLCDLLQTEIIFVKPCENLRQKVTEYTNELIQSMADGNCMLKVCLFF